MIDFHFLHMAVDTCLSGIILYSLYKIIKLLRTNSAK